MGTVGGLEGLVGTVGGLVGTSGNCWRASWD